MRQVGVFKCPVCQSQVEKRMSHGKRDNACGCQYTSNKYGIKGESNSGIYKAWINIMQRCYNPKNRSSKTYLLRGISLCDEWRDYFSFKKWALGNGYRGGMVIHRVDNNGNYEPSNCAFMPKVDHIVFHNKLGNKKMRRRVALSG